MGKYIWPGQLGKAAIWYLELLVAVSGGVTLDEFIELLGEDHPSRRIVQATLERLRQRDLIARKGRGHSLRYEISENGRQQLATLSLFQLKPLTRWDERWRVVLFDIPETKRESRYHIRRLLKELGFVQLQMSVWVHPFPCLEAFRQLQSSYGIKEHLYLLEALDFTPPENIRKHFAKLYPKTDFV